MRSFEKAYPCIIAVVATLASVFLRRPQQIAIAADLANPVLTILAINVGFLAAVTVFLLTAQELKVIQRLKTTDDYTLLVGYHWSAICLGFVAAMLSLLLIAACKTMPPVSTSIVFYGWTLFGIWAFAALFRVIMLLRSLLAI